jgi:hypothetical protein
MSEQKPPLSIETIAKLAADSAQRIAMQIAFLPLDRREAAFASAANAYKETVKTYGFSGSLKAGTPTRSHRCLLAEAWPPLMAR